LLASQQIICHALVWVFAAMLAVAVLGILVTVRIPARKAAAKPSIAHAAEAMAG